jgi:peptidoglycan hydrolase-like protein with peptidoglycan-binding domain
LLFRSGAFQQTSTSGYLRFLAGTQQTAGTNLIEQQTSTSGYLRFLAGTQQTAGTNLIEQQTSTSAYVRFLASNQTLRELITIEQRTKRIKAFLFYRPFINSGADIIPLYKVIPQFDSLPGQPIDGFPTKIIPDKGNQTETKLTTTEGFPFGTNNQGIPKPDIVEEWGKLFVVVDKKDITLFREAEVVIESIAWNAFGNYETIQIEVPAVTEYDNQTTIPWLRSGAAIEVWKEKDNIFELIWNGTIATWEYEQEAGLKITGNGILYDLALQIARPTETQLEKPREEVVRNIINSSKLPIQEMPPQLEPTDITRNDSEYQTALEYIKTILLPSHTLTIDSFGLPRIARFDERRIPSKPPLPIKNINYITGQDGLVNKITFDPVGGEPNVKYTSGTYESGTRWYYWRYPQVKPETSILLKRGFLDTSGIIEQNPVLAYPMPKLDQVITVGTSDADTMIISGFPSSVEAGDTILGSFGALDFFLSGANLNGNGILTLQYLIQWVLGGRTLAGYNQRWITLFSQDFFWPKVYANGTYSEENAADIRTIQAAAGLPVTGIVDTRTWSHLCGVEDITSDAWIGPEYAIIHPQRGRINEQYEDKGTARFVATKGLTEQRYRELFDSNQIEPISETGWNNFFDGNTGERLTSGMFRFDYNITYQGEIDLTLCPPKLESGLIDNKGISRFDIKPRDIFRLYNHPAAAVGSPLAFYITRVEWNLAGAPTVKLQVSTRPIEYSELAGVIYPDA